MPAGEHARARASARSGGCNPDRTDLGAAIAREIGLEKVMFEADLALFGWSIQN
jgi:hypothetical protein